MWELSGINRQPLERRLNQQPPEPWAGFPPRRSADSGTGFLGAWSEILRLPIWSPFGVGGHTPTPERTIASPRGYAP